MPVLALALYGSYARGDHHDHSDIDLFAITDADSYEYKSSGKANISCYPLETVMERCRNGDIFFLHIAKESRPIYDPSDLITRLIESFEFKTDYSYEIKNAADIAWTLIQNKELFINYKKYNARLAWCLRTILIAKAAESRKAIFSAAELGKFSNNQNVEVSINNRENEEIDEKLIDTTKAILKKYNTTPPKTEKYPIKILFYFMRTKNKFGRKIIVEHFFKNNIEDSDYE